MQIMPQTAAELGVGNAYNPEANVNGGSEYLHRLLVQYHGDAQKALAAYNAGPVRVQQYGGVPPYRETRTYVARVINEYNQRKRTAAHEVPARRAGNSAHPKLSASAAR
jgi:soluble lytic murein transglycosylase-like protein